MDRKWRITRITALPGETPFLQCATVEAANIRDALQQNPHGVSDYGIIKIEQLDDGD